MKQFLFAVVLATVATASTAHASDFFNGFETDISGWNSFGVAFHPTRVASGTNGISSADGAFHAEAGTSAGNWGGYGNVDGCGSNACAAATFPPGGYATFVDVYLDVDGGWANNTRFDLSSAINGTAGAHRRDFIINGGFYSDTDVTGPGAGTNRFIFSGSTNSQPGSAFAKNPANGPIAIGTTGWYTFRHHFYNDGGVLAVDMSIIDSGGTTLTTWTRSDASDLIGIIGANRYGWFAFNEFPFLAIDNSGRTVFPPFYDADVTPDVLFGAGNANGSYTIDRTNGVELALRGKLRNPPSNIFKSNGDGTYTFNTGSGTGSFPQSEWSFEWAVNTDYDGSMPLRKVGDLTYEIGMDNDPGAGTDYLVFDPISIGTIIPYTVPLGPIPFWDHSMGDNTFANGTGVEAADGATYATYLTTYNVAQNSWRPTFYQNTAPYSWNPNVPGRYEYYLAAFDGTTELARTAITIFAVDGATLSLEADPCQTDQDAGLAGLQVKVELWLRNPADLEVNGFQAFLSFDDMAATYEGSASSYSAAPFSLHFQSIATANVAPGELRLDGNTGVSPGPTGDALLATLVFTVNECDPTAVTFDLGQPFDSELSAGGSPIATALLDGPSVVVDVTPPSITCPLDITQASDAAVGNGCQGAVVTWADPVATDSCTAVTVVCEPPSGSFFPANTTTLVTATATDECGNTETCTFDVTVTPFNTVFLDVQLVGVTTATTRCIHFVADDCTTADIELAFDATGLYSGAIEIPCGDWTELCAKDEQHTLWDTVELVLTGDGTAYELDPMTPVLELHGGDTDNDGDVDIHDVTFWIAQFGGPEPAGNCPWNGQRGADFSNNGNVGTEDYVFLSSNWLTSSSCGCAMPLTAPLVPAPTRGRGSSLGLSGGGGGGGGGGGAGPFTGASQAPPVSSTPDSGAGLRTRVSVKDLAPALAMSADLNRDGVVDYKDVELLEKQRGLPALLSTRMKASPQR